MILVALQLTDTGRVTEPMISVLEAVECESVGGRDLVGWSSDVEDRPRFEFEAEAGHLEIMRASSQEAKISTYF